jgi:hypothetical protein
VQKLPWLLVTHDSQQAPGFPLFEGLVPLYLQHYCTALLKPTPGKQAPEFLLHEGLVPHCLQQLPWLLMAHTSKQAPGLPLPMGFIFP